MYAASSAVNRGSLSKKEFWEFLQYAAGGLQERIYELTPAEGGGKLKRNDSSEDSYQCAICVRMHSPTA